MKVTFRFVYEDKRSSWCSEDVGCKQSGISFTVRKLCDAVEIAVPLLGEKLLGTSDGDVNRKISYP